MDSDRVLGLFKFGRREHIEELIREGLLFMNPVSYFRTLENDLLRSDKEEGATGCFPASGAKLNIEVNGQWEEIATINGSIITSDGSYKTTNIFCMYSLMTSANGHIDERNFAFGDTCVVLKDADDFLQRVDSSARRNNIDIEHRLVSYVSRETYRGAMDAFTKFSYFAYQSEFRIAIASDNNQPFSLRVGDLTDISILGAACEINEYIKINAGRLSIRTR
ncbi:MAG: hypothetical protein ACYC6O_07530 [Thermoleophilia bacterium]